MPLGNTNCRSSALKLARRVLRFLTILVNNFTVRRARLRLYRLQQLGVSNVVKAGSKNPCSVGERRRMMTTMWTASALLRWATISLSGMLKLTSFHLFPSLTPFQRKNTNRTQTCSIRCLFLSFTLQALL